MKGIAELDLTGFAATEDDGEVQNADGVYLGVTFEDSPPTLAHWVENQKELLSDVVLRLLARGWATIECWIDYPGGLPALFVIYKRHQTAERGRLYNAVYYVPRATCSLTIRLMAVEQLADVGRRENAADNLLPGRAYIPSPRMPLLKTPGGNQLVYDYADSHAVDKMFPDHALTRLRAALRQVFPSVRYEEWFTSLAEFQGSPAAADDAVEHEAHRGVPQGRPVRSARLRAWTSRWKP